MSFLRKIGRKIEEVASLVPGFGVSYSVAEQPIVIDPFNNIRVPGLIVTEERGTKPLREMLVERMVTGGQIRLKEKSIFPFGLGPKKSIIDQGLDLGYSQQRDGTVITYRIPENAKVSKFKTEPLNENLHTRWDLVFQSDEEKIDKKTFFDQIKKALNVPDSEIESFQKPVGKNGYVTVERVKLQQDLSLGGENYPAGTILYSDGRATKPSPPSHDYSIPVIVTHKKRKPVGRAFKVPGWHQVESFPTGPNPYPVRMVPATERIGLLSMRLLTGDTLNKATQAQELGKNDHDNLMLPYITPAFDAQISVPPHLAEEVALRIAGGGMNVEGLVRAVRAQVAPIIIETAFANEVSIPVPRNSENEPQQLITLRPAEVFALQQISTVSNLDPHLASKILLDHMTELSREALEENGIPGEVLKRIQIATPADAGEIKARVKETTESRLDMLVQGEDTFRHLQALQILARGENANPNIFFQTDGNSSAESGIGMNLSERLASLENSVRSLINEQDNI